MVLADIDAEALALAEADLAAAGSEVLAVRTNVTKLEDIEALANKTMAVFGGVHLLVNNAGVGGGSSVLDSTIKDWEWVIGVDLWSVIYGVKVFGPIMLAQGEEGHIVNTASIAGLFTGPSPAPYTVAKCGVVGLSESLYHELAYKGARVGVSVLSPAFVKTDIIDSERNRPQDLCNRPEEEIRPPNYEMMHQIFKQMIESGLGCDVVAEKVFSAVSEGKFYILTHPDLNGFIKTRMEDLLTGRNPTSIIPGPYQAS